MNTTLDPSKNCKKESGFMGKHAYIGFWAFFNLQVWWSTPTVLAFRQWWEGVAGRGRGFQMTEITIFKMKELEGWNGDSPQYDSGQNYPK